MEKNKLETTIYILVLIVICVCSFLTAKYIIRKSIQNDKIPVDTSTKLK